MTIVLASQSAARRAMLDAAGIRYEAVTARIDEAAARDALRAAGHGARDLTDSLAELKAARVAPSRPDAIVIGCDQTLERDDGVMFDKPGDDLADQLHALSGRVHRLHSAAVAVEQGRPVWRHVETVTLTMRVLSASFIATYVETEGPHVAGCVGGYRIEGPGIHLFSHIRGSHFAILGLPLLPLLTWLRQRGEIAS